MGFGLHTRLAGVKEVVCRAGKIGQLVDIPVQRFSSVLLTNQIEANHKVRFGMAAARKILKGIKL